MPRTRTAKEWKMFGGVLPRRRLIQAVTLTEKELRCAQAAVEAAIAYFQPTHELKRGRVV